MAQTPITSTSTRRAFIGAASLTIPVAAMAAMPIVSNPRREWDRLVAEFHRADAALKAAEKPHNAAETAYFAERELLGDRPTSPDADYPRPISEMTFGELRNFTPSAEKQEQYAAALATWNAKSDELRQRYQHGEDEWEDAVDAREDAVRAIFAYPAPDRAALLFKLDLAEREYHGLGIDLDATIARQIFADMRRFARGEA